MIDLIKKEKIGDDLIQEFKMMKYDELYECFLDGKKIGFAIIRENKNDRIFLVIAEQYQGKGHGSAIFRMLLSKIDGEIRCIVPFDNVKMHRIICNNNGIEVGRNGKEVLYIIE